MDPKPSLIASRRRQKKLSQEGLAQLAGLSQATISRVEKGEGSTLQVLAKIARALDVPVREIAEESGLQNLFEQSEAEIFYAICPNPFCKKNELILVDGKPAVSWSSGQFYPMARLQETNFCPSCGTELAKECPSCGKILEEKNARFCIRCGNPIHKRPTPEEWIRIGKLFSNDDIPF
jgi:transcriptional regulator with XRE-family HTH domain